MKQTIRSIYYSCTLFIMALFMSLIGIAQDSTASSSTTTVKTTTQEQTWYAQPWVWVVGGIAVLLLIILLARGNGDRNERVTITKIKDTV